ETHLPAQGLVPFAHPPPVPELDAAVVEAPTDPPPVLPELPPPVLPELPPPVLPELSTPALPELPPPVLPVLVPTPPSPPVERTHALRHTRVPPSKRSKFEIVRFTRAF